MKNPEIENVEFLAVELIFEVPVERNLYDLGSVKLERNGRNFILDIIQSYTNQDKDEITCELSVDTDPFPVGVEYNYALTANDLMSDDLNASIYIGDEYEEEPQSITLFVKIGVMTRAIDLKIE